MNTLIIGYGSIGARHAKLIQDLGHDISCATSNPSCPFRRFNSIAQALSDWLPELVIVSTPTAVHHASLTSLDKEGYRGTTLVEKPLFHKSETNTPLKNRDTFVAYNLRFHPIIIRTRELLRGKKILNARFHVGQYLPDWRPGTDYRTSYSADKCKGGGVLRDLSHELDMATWLLGSWKRVTAIGGRFSELEISSDDTYSLLLETAHCPCVSVSLDYLCRKASRGFTINAEGLTVHGSFTRGTLAVNDREETFTTYRDTTYEAQLRALLEGRTENMCTYEQGMDVVTLIAAAEKAAQQQTWIEKK